jgi:hypothetical protein
MNNIAADSMLKTLAQEKFAGTADARNVFNQYILLLFKKKENFIISHHNYIIKILYQTTLVFIASY